MGIRSFAFAEGEFFHIYNRGNSKQDIFRSSSDYRRLMTLMFVSNSTESFKLFFIDKPYEINRHEPLVAVGAYCLMPNHFHILLTPEVEGGVSMFMKKLSTGYSMYFNNKYGRTGALFEGRFKAKLVDDDTYLKYLYAYIHLNPIKLIQSDWKESGISNRKSAKTYLQKYDYSSFKDYIGERRKEGGILNSEPFPNYFSSTTDFESNIFDWFENKQT